MSVEGRERSIGMGLVFAGCRGWSPTVEHNQEREEKEKDHKRSKG